MSGICEIFPDDPSCVVEEVVEEPVATDDGAAAEEEEVVEGGDEEGAEEEGEAEEEDAAPAAKADHSEAAAKATADWNRVKDMAHFAMVDPMMSNLQFFGVAAGWALNSAMRAFRYRSKDKYYDSAAPSGDTNYWKTADTLRNYGGLAIGGLLATTQLMALLGIAVPLNGQVWMVVGGLGGMVLNMVLMALYTLGYDNGYSNTKSSTAATAAAGAAAMKSIRFDATSEMAMDAAAGVALAVAAEGWHYNLWNAQTDEQQEALVMEWEETIATRAAAVAEARAAMAPAAAKEEEPEEEEEAEEGEEGEEGEEAEEGEEGEAAEEEAAEE